MITVKAQLNGLRIAPRKVRAVAGLMRRKPAIKVLSQLDVLARKPATNLVKLLNSAIANAKSRYDIDVEDLFISDVKVDEGIKLRRFKPKGFGRVSPLEKKTSRITITLTSKKQVNKKEGSVDVSKDKESKVEKTVKKEKITKVANEKGVSKPKVATAKKIFQRKAI